MSSRPGILFICTGNIFRSMTAEVALKSALGPGAAYTVRSAGLIEAPHDVVFFVIDFLAERALDISRHQPTRLTETMLDQAGLAVAMGIEHRDRISAAFDRRLPLFSEVAYETEEALRDVYEVVPDWRTNEAAAVEYGRSVMAYIVDGMPGFVSRMGGFMRSGRAST